MVFTSRSPEETAGIGREIARTMIQRHKPDFVALFGDLGAGKTHLTQGIVSVLCPCAHVSSPTYALVNHYKSGGPNVYHCDMYRVTDPDQLYATGFYDLLDEGIVITEWSENIAYALPESYLSVTITKSSTNENERAITVERVEKQ